MPHTLRPIFLRRFARRREGPARRELSPWIGSSLADYRSRVDHIITLGWRGASDDATIVVSRVRQARRLDHRIQVWSKAVNDLVETSPVARRFELTDDGVLLPWSTVPLDR